ncbi:MAG TPA: GNAT family N-acetyltransferase [Candidatus Bathyarchaeia archaeon]|nr:GNAT family N-acetyltransferase [Candidatus Bathyarchaeia archaeon]
MNYLFKELTRKDIPAMKEIVEDMPYYFQRVVDYSPILMDYPNCYLYGVFLDNQLLGFGNLRKKTSSYTWIESIRVNTKSQLKGIGTALFSHGVEKAKKENFPVVAYATEASNQGSCSIGRKLGFQMIEEMKPLWVEPKKVVIDKNNLAEQKTITNEEAINLLTEIPNKPHEDICLGWEFGPIEKEFLEQYSDMKFFAIENTILLEYKERDLISKEITNVKAIVYGLEENIEELLLGFIKRNNTNEYLSCIITEKLEKIPQTMGFQNAISDDGIQNKILLWKKNIE